MRLITSEMLRLEQSAFKIAEQATVSGSLVLICLFVVVIVVVACKSAYYFFFGFLLLLAVNLR